MKKLRSRVTTDGLDRAPHRAFMRAMGLDDAAIAKPMVGVVSMKGEQTPCNMTHDFQVAAAKTGIEDAGGTPREFSTVSVSDGISMNHEGMKFSLFSRELIADSIEAVVHGLAYDALIGYGGCDKTLPGVMMGMVRCNVPSIFIYGGSSLPGRVDGRTLTVLDSYEAVGSFMTGEIDGATLERIERACLPTIGACAGQFTANTMGMVSEAMGLTIPNVSMVPGVYAERAQISRRAGRLIMEMLERGGPLPRDIVTRKSIENGARCRITSTATFVLLPLCHPIHTSRLTISGAEIATRYGFDGGFVEADNEKAPSPAVVTAASSHVGSIRAPPTGRPLEVSTTCPDADHVVDGAVGGVGVVGVTGVVEEPPPPQAITIAGAATSNARHRKRETRVNKRQTC